MLSPVRAIMFAGTSRSSIWIGTPRRREHRDGDGPDVMMLEVGFEVGERRDPQTKKAPVVVTWGSCSVDHDRPWRADGPLRGFGDPKESVT